VIQHSGTTEPPGQAMIILFDRDGEWFWTKSLHDDVLAWKAIDRAMPLSDSEQLVVMATCRRKHSWALTHRWLMDNGKKAHASRSRSIQPPRRFRVRPPKGS